MKSLIFDEDGYLTDDTHEITKEEFINYFCLRTGGNIAKKKQNIRAWYAEAFENLWVWASSAGAASIIVGGSFITSEPSPGDIDVLVVFSRRSDIKNPEHSFGNEHAIVDVQCLSEDEPELLQAYMQLIGADRRYIGRGLVQIKLHSKVATHIRSKEQSRLLAAAMGSYIYRHRPSRSTSERLIIPIHGIRSDADWIPKFTFLASASGWAVAPFVYGYESGLILRDKKRKAEIVNDFRLWLNEIRKTFKGSISIVAHSFGSYIVGRYLSEAKDLIETFGGVVLAGSILSTDFDWPKLLEKQEVNMVLNTRSSNDEWVSMLPEGGVKHIAEDSLMGPAAVEGFKRKHARLTERESGLLKHSNIFESDVITRLWLPFLSLAERQVPMGDWIWAEDEDFE